MVKITFIDFDGTVHDIEMETGQSLMEGAVANGIEGIVADCGGALACATCHCYIDADWQDRVGEPTELEKEMLECANEPEENSRLSCQVQITEELDGLVVSLPESQL
nr:putative ferredoxin, 2Fe-2S [uncultured bacterium]